MYVICSHAFVYVDMYVYVHINATPLNVYVYIYVCRDSAALSLNRVLDRDQQPWYSDRGFH